MQVQGGVDLLDRHGIQGWVRNDDAADTPVNLLIKVDGQVTNRVLANLYRADLEDAGIGDGRFGFAVKLEGIAPTRPHTVEVVTEDGLIPLHGTPRLLPASAEPDGELEAYLTDLLSHVESRDAQRHWATFLAEQADRLLQRRADEASRKPRRSAPREFRVRWSGEGPPPTRERAPRALVIDETLPDASRDAGSQAILSHIRSLQRLGHEVTFAASDMAGGPGAAALEAEGVTCYCAPWCASVEEVLRRENAGFALVYVHRSGNTRYLPLIRHYQPRARVIYSVADLHHLRLARQATVEERPELMAVSQRLRNVELGAARFAEAVITHSSFERDVIRNALPGANVHVVPWSVPPQPVTAPWTERHGIAFIGSYNHPPNVDAAWWLIQDIMPLVLARNPGIECLLAGSNMPDTLRSVEAPGVRALGYVPDLPALFGRVRLTVAPLTFGAGLKGKVLDSLAAGLPCACTPVAAEGMEFPGPLQDIVADEPAALAEAILRLHGDAAFNAACGEAGLRYVAERLSDTAVDTAMRGALGLART